MKKTTINLFGSMARLFFPKLCVGCRGVLQPYEKTLYLKCELCLPLCYFTPHKTNIMQQRLSVHIPVEYATALFLFYPKGIIEQLIHQLKYNGQRAIGILFGAWMADQLSHSFFEKCTAVIPMPLHPKRQRKRGYNQVEGFAKQIADKLAIPVCNHVVWRKKNTRQLAQGKVENRWEELADAFALNPNHNLTNQHWLLVDDVMTTGASLCACAKALLEIRGSKVSIVTMAYRV
ncbi:MAG: ComF family protein [Flavobacteriaceae bacterium]